MELNVERRRAERCRIDTGAIVRRGDGEPIPVDVTGIGSSGMLVGLRGPCPFQVGEDVTAEVELPGHSHKPLSHRELGLPAREPSGPALGYTGPDDRARRDPR
jgi:hypothetical protein